MVDGGGVNINFAVQNGLQSSSSSNTGSSSSNVINYGL